MDHLELIVSTLWNRPLIFKGLKVCGFFQLVQENDTILLGIILLQTASEELAVPREDLSMARKEELQKLLLQQVPTVLSILNSKIPSTLNIPPVRSI